MATGKKYYWIKLKKDFLTGERIDFLMSQKNGAQYVVLYLLLCMMCINTDGKLEQKFGEVIVPFDIDKIQRDCKYFNKDTVIVAMQLYQKLGLIYEGNDGSLIIANYDEMVGSTTDYAAQKASQRARINADNHVDSIADSCVDNVHTEIRDKRLEIRDKETRDKSTEVLTVPNGTVRHTEAVRRVLEAWNSMKDIGIKPLSRITAGTKRYTSLIARLNEYGEEDVIKAIGKIRDSDFLQGKTGRKGWVITFDWFVLPNNFPKVLEGNYDNDKGQGPEFSTMDEWKEAANAIRRHSSNPGEN